MRRRLLLAVLSVSVGIAGWPAWGQAKNQPTQPQQPATNKSTQTQPFQLDAQGSPIVIQITHGPEGQTQTAQTQKTGTGKDFYDKLTVWVAVVAALSTLALVGVGYCGVRAAVKSLGEMRDQRRVMQRQLSAMQRQSRLMEAGMAQWVSIKNWQVIVEQRRAPLSNEPRVLKIGFDIANESQLPIRMTGHFVIHGPSGPRGYITQSDALLLPRSPYRVSLRYFPDDVQARLYAESHLAIAIAGRISHIGATGDPAPFMDFHGILTCAYGLREPTFEFDEIKLVREGGDPEDGEDERPN